MVSSARPRVLLADDDPGILKAFERLLRPSCEVVGRVTNVGELLEAAMRLRPDVVVVDLFMPTGAGLEACHHLKEAVPRTKIIVVSGADDVRMRDEVLRAGASAYIPKVQAAQELLPAVQDSTVD
jgi:DNA-binding NarL/FixJ family response regulator